MATYKRNKSGGTQSEGPQSNSASPASSITHSNHGSSHNINNNAPKYGTLVPNRIFVGGISSSTTEGELSQLFSKYGTVKATKIIADRAGVSKGYGFVTFESEEEVKYLVENANNVVLRERRLNIAPAIKKQPFSRSFETSSPPPATPNLYYSHNGVPYTFHNGMAFFPPTAHQPALTAVPSTDPSIFPQFGQPQNGPPASYGAPLLVPAPMFLPPQNYPYQPMQLANGSQLVYPGSGSSNTSSAGTPDMPPTNTHLPLPPPHPPQFYPSHQYAGPEGFYPPPYFISYNTYSTVGEYESNEHVPTEVMQQQQTYERPVLMSTVITSQRWSSNPASLKRNVIYKRQNGSNSNVGSGAPRMNNNNNNNKPSGGAEAAATGDLGGGGDAPPPSQLALTPPSTPSKTGRKQDVTSKMQTLSLGSSS
ncbi:protein boule-like isoform X3 [Macrosteles quadrilineatus]|uniref:protein boule-like isoform X3 n=1 Tax=Macrosteles quadrilineatus TaxID=74068 RepID=UPI0023E299D8|nr:protein boule-like isoform X3 [Macrosteles quadrilineatus]